MATGVASWSQTAGTNATADSAVNWAENQAPSTVNDSARGLMASVAKWRDDISGSLTTGGTSTAYTLTSNQSFASLSALGGQMLYMKMSATSGASPTLAVDGLTAKALTTDGSTAIATGALISGSIWGVTYNVSAGAFIVHAAPSATPSFTTISATTISATGQFLGANGTVSAPSFAFTNDTDCGWYRIGANNLGLALNGANVIDASTTTVAITGDETVSGALTVTGNIAAANFGTATQAQQETASSTAVFVTPGRQQYHPGHPKLWLRCDNNGGTTASYNITSITDTGTGIVDVTVATDFSSSSWTPVVCGIGSSNNVLTMIDDGTPPAAGTYRIRNLNAGTSGAADAVGYCSVGFGDQA